MPTEDFELIPGTRLTVDRKEMPDMPIWPCEQCDGWGYCIDGSRCACREEDDEAVERRRNLQVICRAD